MDKSEFHRPPVAQIFDARKDFIVIGLTGRIGSGCSFVSSIFEKNFEGLALRKPSYENLDNNERDYRIIYRYTQNNWKPFFILKVRDVITSFILDDLNGFIDLLCDKYKYVFNGGQEESEAKEIIKKAFEPLKDLLKIPNELYNTENEDIEQLKHSLIKAQCGFDSVNQTFKRLEDRDKKDNVKQEDILNANKFIRDCIKRFSKYIQDQLKLFDVDAYTKVYQMIGNHLRYSGAITYQDQVDKINIISIAKRINTFIKILRRSNNTNDRLNIVIDEIKNPFEASYLRDRYTAFYLMAISTDEDIRIRRLRDKINMEKNDPDVETKMQIMDANENPHEIRKEYNKFCESEENKPYSSNKEYLNGYFKSIRSFDKCRANVLKSGNYIFCLQNIQDCITNADIFINNKNTPDSCSTLKECVVRYVALMMHPGLVVPTEIERCMQIAYTAKVNSGCISRQVGAVITDKVHNIISIGWNDAPCETVSCLRRNLVDLYHSRDKLAYSPYESASEKEAINLKNIDFVNKRDKLATTILKNWSEVTQRLKGLPMAYCFKDIYNDVMGDNNQVHTRALHGEERAFLNCSKDLAKKGCLFTTSSPCELCAKKAAEFDIEKIYYIEPYPGISQSHVMGSSANRDTISFHLFTGAIGRAYSQIFTPIIPLKDELKLRGVWGMFDKSKDSSSGKDTGNETPPLEYHEVADNCTLHDQTGNA